MKVLWCELPQEYSDEFKTPVDTVEGALPPGSKFVIAVLEQAGHHVDVRVWDKIGPPDGHAIVMVALMFCRQYTSLPELFRRLGLPPEVADRHGRPPVVCGGHGIHNPLPLARMFDRVVLGDGEQIAPDLVRDLTAWDHTPHVWPNTTGRAVKRAEPVCPLISRQYGRLTKYIEIARGCRGRCGFCELGWTHKYREARWVDVCASIDACQRGDQAHLLAPDAAGWPYYSEAITRMQERGLLVRYNSLRVDSSEKQTNQSATMRFGLEGPSERIRARLLKPYRDERILERLLACNEAGVSGFRLFFLWGLPWTQRRDYEELWDLLGLIRFDRGGAITIKFTAIIPQPGTPFAVMPIASNVREYAYLADVVRRGPQKQQNNRTHSRTGIRFLPIQTLGRQALEVYFTRAGWELLDVLNGLEKAGPRIPMFGTAAISRIAKAAGVPWDAVMQGRNLGLPVEPIRTLPLPYRQPSEILWRSLGSWEGR